MSKTYTKGNIVVENIEIGDIHYEFEYGVGCKSVVRTLPVRNEDGLWTWQSENLTTGKTIDYPVHEKYSHYGPNLYDYNAYAVNKWI